MLRPEQHLAEIGRKYPDAWKNLESLYMGKGTKGLPDWPDWCYVPVSGAHAVVSGGVNNRVPVNNVPDIPRVAALGPWRVTKGVYRFHEEVARPLWESPLPGKLPTDVLQRLPEWCVYIELPEGFLADTHGFFAHLEWDASDGHEELRLLFDVAVEDREVLLPLQIHLGHDLETGLRAMEEYALRTLREVGTINVDSLKGDLPTRFTYLENISGCISLLLYLISARDTDLRDAKGTDAKPDNPTPKKTKKGLRLFPPTGPKVWEAGYRLGSFLAKAKSEGGGGSGDGAERAVTPHIRRAHWHTYWTGPRKDPDRRAAVVKWLPPIRVGVDEGLIPTVRVVK